MRYLLDTHTYLWSLLSPELLSPQVFDIVSDSETQIVLSTVSLWEAAIKIAKGKLTVPGRSIQFLLDEWQDLRGELLPITPMHLLALETLLHLHKDPFDRLLIAQAKAEAMTLLTVDGTISQYGIQTLWD